MLTRLRKGPGNLARIARQVRQRQGRDAAEMLRRVGVPAMRSIDLTRRLKIAANPFVYLGRKAPAAGAQQTFEATLARQHFVRVPDGLVPGVDPLVTHCAALFAAKSDALVASYKPPYGEVIRTLVADGAPIIESVEEVRPIARFIAQPEILGVATRYLGERPVLSTVGLLYTQPNSVVRDAQAFHRDMQDRNHVHVVVPIWEVDEDAGPFTLISAAGSDKIIKRVGYNVVRITDEEVIAVVPETEWVRLTGKPGTVYFCNPFRCIHFGARARSKPRLLLIVNLTSAFEGVEGLQSVYRARNRGELDDGTPEMRSLLDL